MKSFHISFESWIHVEFENDFPQCWEIHQSKELFVASLNHFAILVSFSNHSSLLRTCEKYLLRSPTARIVRFESQSTITTAVTIARGAHQLE